MKNVTFNDAGVSAHSDLNQTKHVFSKEIIKVRCLFREMKVFQPFQASSTKDLDGNELNNDVIYFADHASRNYEHYVLAKLSHTPFVADLIYVNDIEKKQHHAAASKSLNEIKRLIFGILEELPQTKRQTLKELYNKEIDSQRSELHEYLDFYMMLLELKENET